MWLIDYLQRVAALPETKGIGFPGFLIKPGWSTRVNEFIWRLSIVQRICKYPILLKVRHIFVWEYSLNFPWIGTREVHTRRTSRIRKFMQSSWKDWSSGWLCKRKVWNFHRNFAENQSLRKRMAENEKKLAEIKGMLEGLEVISWKWVKQFELTFEEFRTCKCSKRIDCGNGSEKIDEK